MPWITVKKYPRWIHLLMYLAKVIGVEFSAYWIINGGIFVLRSVGA